jgi:hypothetical protein
VRGWPCDSSSGCVCNCPRTTPTPNNLLKTTVDAMEGVLGLHRVQDPPQADDERIDYLEVLKRQARTGDERGAIIEVNELAAP